MSIPAWPHQRPPRYLAQPEARRFFAAISSARDRALFTLMYHHGLRVGEVLLLRREDVDLARGRLLVRRLKGGAWCEQILLDSTAAILKRYLATSRLQPDEPLFPGREGPLKRRRIQALFVCYRARAGLATHFTTHSLRHSIATHLLEAGASLEFVQDHLGHQNIRSTAIYARITDRHRESLMRSLERSPWIVKPGTNATLLPPPEVNES
jgi:site-specific recombinase XerD